jgi:protein involved in polysaccharide export with SLBB domain
MTSGKQRRLMRVCGGGAALMAAAAGLTGCETDSFIDPSVTGRWEMTPTVMPILDRLSSIEEQPAETVRSEAIQPQDLIPEIEQYRFGAGDVVEVIIRDFVTPGAEERFQQTVDSRGYIYIPKLAPIRAGRRTNTELAQSVREEIRNAGIRADLNAVVSINVLSQRSQTFSMIGAVQTQQEYFIPKPDYRLLDALSAAGGFNETIETIYVIRQVPLSDAASGTGVSPPPPTAQDNEPTPAQPKKPADLLDLIDKLGNPPAGNKPNPGRLADRRQPEAHKAEPNTSTPPPAPPIDLPDGKSAAAPAKPSPESGWVYDNGQWMKNTPATAAAGTPGAGSSQPVVTQRIVEVPVARLLAGDASVNVVVRPGDVVRVPPPKTGVVYLTGQVVRPGPYSLSGDTKLTLLRGLDSAGGLGSIAIPERTDLTRVVGPGRQATIRLDLRAISEQTQPDIYLKPDDRINVGTNFWALPLAVLRGGFRASYGFGFILDRNFASYVYGPDPDLNRN